MLDSVFQTTDELVSLCYQFLRRMVKCPTMIVQLQVYSWSSFLSGFIYLEALSLSNTYR